MYSVKEIQYIYFLTFNSSRINIVESCMQDFSRFRGAHVQGRRLVIHARQVHNKTVCQR